MPTVVRYTGHPSGYMDFYFGEELILCQNTIPEVTAQQLWDGITDVEDDPLALGFLGIAFAEGKTQFVDTALSVVLARNWRIGSEKTSGSFLLKDGNVVSETLGVFPFEVNNSVFMANQTIQFGVQIATGSGITEQDKDDIALKVWDFAKASANKAGSMGELVSKKLLTFIQFIGLK